MRAGVFRTDTGAALLARAPIEATLGIKKSECERKGKAKIRFTKVPACYLLNPLETIGGGVAMHS